jgi:Zinc finger C-x8-C-x5-C-x3-H type (and similar)/RNA-binding, Nab2-type zinc finger
MEILDNIENTQEIKLEILCKYFNGYDKSCLNGDDCKFKHSNFVTDKNLCRNWSKNGECEYGQNCNFFHYSSSNTNPKIKKLENPKKGKKPTIPIDIQPHKKSEFTFNIL